MVNLQAVKKNIAESATVSEKQNTGNSSKVESLPTKILTVQSPVNTNQLQYTVGKHIFNWVQSNLVEIISSIGVTVGILFTVLNYRITFLKWIGRNSGVSQKKIAKRYQDYLREELRDEARQNLESRIGAEYRLEFSPRTSCTEIIPLR